jgi:hypothetical protein
MIGRPCPKVIRDTPYWTTESKSRVRTVNDQGGGLAPGA